ncbi:MAG: type IX secretion system sortase PorU [Bacteroidia bacterium]
MLFSQKNRSAAGTAAINPSSAISTAALQTKTVSSSSLTDDAGMPVKLDHAHYDQARNNLPYFLESKRVSVHNTLKASLKNVQIVDVPAQVAQKITSVYGKFLTGQFQTSLSYGQSGNDHIGYLKITPYRISTTGTVEELVAYETEWDVTAPSGSQKMASTAGFTTTSVLASGNWYKIGITKTGMHKIDKTLLQSIGINLTGLDPKTIRIYGNGGHMLPQANNVFRYDDLQENAIQVVGEGDGTFDPGDYIVFYGVGPDQWTFDKSHTTSCITYNHQLNLYSDTSYYYITTDFGPGMRVSDKASLSAIPTASVSAYDYYDYHEVNTTNFIKSGRNFYGEYFDLTTTYSFGFPIPNLVLGDTVNTLVTIAGRADVNSLYTISYSGSAPTLTIGAVNVEDYLGDYVAIGASCSYALANSPNFLSYSIIKQTPNAIGWLDNIVFNCRRQLIFNGTQFGFRDGRTVKKNVRSINKYLMSNASSSLTIWDVTDPLHPQNQLYNTSGSFIDFTSTGDSLREFEAFNGSDFLIPSFVTKIANQNLHSTTQADFIIVTPPQYLSQAQRLAKLHIEQDTLSVSVVTTEQVYNEFSSGRPDIVGIRDFVRMIYKRNLSSGKQVKYLLLYGDGSYKIKDRYAYGNTSIIPVYETDNSYSPTLSTVSDDFFGWMDDIEGDDWSAGLVDIGVGRFPVNTVQQATDAVAKMEAYYKKNFNFTLNEPESACTNTTCYPLGDWRNWVCFVADDEDYQTHMHDADQLATKVRTEHPEYNIDKIYADAYIQYTTPGGQRYPDVNANFDHRVEKGAIILNYTGHGGEVGLGHERYLELSQINGYNNICNLPLFVTATCEFSRFDDPDRESAGELCFTNPNGAAIGLLTTVRLAFSNTNLVLNSNLYDFAFSPLTPGGKMPALGDIVKQTKQKSGISFYYLNFHLLGDPALRLAYPQHQVVTTSINGKTVPTTTTTVVVDTLKALQKVTVKGYVGIQNGSTVTKMTSFNGILYPTVFDKEQLITCLGNDAESLSNGLPFQFKLQKNIIYRGKVEVDNGDFSFNFIVPKDISYNYDFGKISYYAQNGITDATGYDNSFFLGGSATNVTPDNVGPTIGLYLNDKKFVSGGTTNENPSLYAEVADSSGINTVGTGIGHDISAVLDDNSSKPVILNDYYEANLNSFQSGKIKYPFSDLPEGNHRLSLKVWDVQNNSSMANTDFVVAKSADMALTHVLNYPNPFTTRTKFYFENNQCCLQLKVNIQIFTISGKVVKTISLNIKNDGFRSDGIDWDGKDDYGDKLAKGVYIYKISVSDPDNKKAEKTEKLVILN